jgi:hypothetical protein
MIVVHFAKVSTLYPWVVISSLAKRLEKPPFCHFYTSFGVWPRDHYMSLQRFTMGHMSGLAKVSRGSHGTTTPLVPCEPGRVTTPNFHSSKQGTLSTASLISKQVISYRTRGSTYYPGVSTPMTRSLTDSGMTYHLTWWIPTISTIPNLAQTTAPNLTTVTSHHDGRKTNTLNIPQVKLNIRKVERLTRHSRLHG